MTVRFGAITIDWLGYATVRIEGQTGAVVYIDPGRYGVLEGYNEQDGDLILVSHDHHYDPAAIGRVSREDALVVVYEAVDADRIDREVCHPDALPYTVERVGEDEVFAIGPLDLFTTPASNHADGDHLTDAGEPVHPPGFGCGFGVTIDGETVFWPGDTDPLEYHERMEVSVFLPPIGGTYTMNRIQAAELAGVIEPELVIPVHYDTFEAIETDEAAFVVDIARQGFPVALDSDSSE